MTKPNPILFRHLHQALHYCNSARHAAYYLISSHLNGEFIAISVCLGYSAYLIRSCGNQLEDGFGDDVGFELPDELVEEEVASVQLLQALHEDMQKSLVSVKEAISLLPQHDDEAIEILQEAVTCIKGVLLPFEQAKDCLELEIAQSQLLHDAPASSAKFNKFKKQRKAS